MKVLVVEDDVSIWLNIKDYLEEHWYNVEHEENWYKAFFSAKNKKYDLIVLDLMLPDKDWISIARDLRTLWINTPILMLTAKDSLDSKLEWFKVWADDYLVKPFSLKELLVRVQSIVRRVYFDNSKIDHLTVWNMTIDFNLKELYVNWNKIELTKKEYLIMEYLFMNKNKVVSKKEIEEHIWWINHDIWSDVVRVHVQMIRAKIWDKEQTMIKTVRWLWFKISDDE